MCFTALPRLRGAILFSLLLVTSAVSAFAGPVSITSPAAGSSYAGAVAFAAAGSETVSFHLEIWDNGTKLGDVFSSSVNTSFALSTGSHTATILAVSNSGVVLHSNSVSYAVAATAQPTGTVSITSPTSGSTSINAVRINATANNSSSAMLQIWDNGTKLGDVFASAVNGIYVLPNGLHVLTVESVSSSGALMSKSSVAYMVADPCMTSANVQCNFDQLPLDTTQNNCNPPIEINWVANSCGSGIQGTGGSYPLSTGLELISESGTPADQNNYTLGGHSLHLSETQGRGGFSNVLFRGISPTTASTTSIDSHWVMDEYVYVPDPTAHQALEMDAQVSLNGIWTKFYTECAFDMYAGTGYWAVFDTNTGGWIFLNGQTQNGETPPIVPCNRSQFAQPWLGSSHPSFTGWHHISWSFLRNGDGTVTFQSVTFDGTTTTINFKPKSATGGAVSDNGNFSTLIQLDGASNTNGTHNSVDLYVSQVSLSHTP